MDQWQGIGIRARTGWEKWMGRANGCNYSVVERRAGSEVVIGCRGYLDGCQLPAEGLVPFAFCMSHMAFLIRMHGKQLPCYVKRNSQKSNGQLRMNGDALHMCGLRMMTLMLESLR